MNGLHRFLVSAIVLNSVTFCFSREGAIASCADNLASDQWIASHLRDGGELPFSFVYAGQSSTYLLSHWPRTQSTKSLDKTRQQICLTWTDPTSLLEVRCNAVVYADFPAVEWTVYFKNTGHVDTSVLADIQGVDAKFVRQRGDEFILHGINGDWASRESYQPYDLILTPGLTEERRPDGSGKSCDGRKGWPYFNLQQGEGGVMLAIGWPGQWRALLERDTGTSLRIRAGQETTHLYLKPGEEVRTPLIAMLFWKGTNLPDAQNLWRRWMITHNLPRINGQLPGAQILGTSSHQFSEMTKATEENQKQFIDGYLAHGIALDYWWMDAGWYPCDGKWVNTGTWEPDSTRFPKGLRPVSDHALARGMKTVLWFEPERVGDPTSWLAKNHPEWLLENDASGSILNMGDPAALAWVINHMDGLIKSEGVHFYREDMNGRGPLLPWHAHDPKDRQGITENFYIQGHLSYWDALRQRNPELRIDSCAGGGRRNDLESMRRAVPLLRSDYLFEPAGQQAHTYGLSNWLPYQGTGYLAGASVLGPQGPNGINVYAFRSTICVSHTISLDVRDPTVDWPLLKRLEEQHRQIGPLFLQNYYPLTSYSLLPDQWMAWQFNDPEQGVGMIQVFRREKCDGTERTFPLRALDPAATYEIADIDSERVLRQTGAELMATGLVVAIGERPGASILTYRRLR